MFRTRLASTFALVTTLALFSACDGGECHDTENGTLCIEPSIDTVEQAVSEKPVMVLRPMTCEPDSVVVHPDGSRTETGTCSNGVTTFRYTRWTVAGLSGR